MHLLLNGLVRGINRVQQGIQLTKSSSDRIKELSEETGYPRNSVLEQQLIKLLEDIAN